MNATPTTAPVTAVIFDIGGVLVDWDPRHLFQKLFDDSEAMEQFLGEVCTRDWHDRLDAGRPVDEAVRELAARYPHEAHLIFAYRDRFGEMFRGEIEGSVALLRQLHDRGLPLFALTNFSADFFGDFCRDFPFTALFRDILVSGAEKMVKPDLRIYDLALSRFGLNARHTLFIDDRAENVAAADRHGLQTHHFEGSEGLARKLAALGLL